MLVCQSQLGLLTYSRSDELDAGWEPTFSARLSVLDGTRDCETDVPHDQSGYLVRRMSGGGDVDRYTPMGRSQPNASNLQGMSDLTYSPSSLADARQIGSQARPATPSDISPDAADFLHKTFEIDYKMRPTAQQLLEHPFLAQRPTQLISAQQAKASMAAAQKAMQGGMQSMGQVLGKA